MRDRINKFRLESSKGACGGTSNTTNNDYPQEILDDLDCICCYEKMGMNGEVIFQCCEGHLICPKCHQRLNRCPLCRKIFTKPGIRNRIAESLVNHLQN